MRVGRGLKEHGQKPLAVHRRRPLPGIGVHAAPKSQHGTRGYLLYVNDRPGGIRREAVAEIDYPELLEHRVAQLLDAQGRELLLRSQGKHGAGRLFMTISGNVVIGGAIGRCEIHAVRIYGQRQNMFGRMLEDAENRAAGHEVTRRREPASRASG